MSRSTQAISLEACPSLSNIAYKDARKRLLEKLRFLMKSQSANVSKSQKRYNRNFDSQLSKQRYMLIECVLIYVRRYYAKSDQVGKRKLAPTADGPYYVRKLRDTSAVIKTRDNLETVALDRVVPAQAPRGSASIPRPVNGQNKSPRAR